jgi:hypothetical protein
LAFRSETAVVAATGEVVIWGMDFASDFNTLVTPSPIEDTIGFQIYDGLLTDFAGFRLLG